MWEVITITLELLLNEKRLSFSFEEPLKLRSGLNLHNQISQVNVSGTITKDKAIYIVKGLGIAILQIGCDRCTVPVTQKIEFDIDLELKESDIHLLDGERLKLDDYVLIEIYHNIPMQTLCSANCKGLCYICGCNYNIDSCNHKDCVNSTVLEKKSDKRFDVLKELKF